MTLNINQSKRLSRIFQCGYIFVNKNRNYVTKSSRFEFHPIAIHKLRWYISKGKGISNMSMMLNLLCIYLVNYVNEAGRGGKNSKNLWNVVCKWSKMFGISQDATVHKKRLQFSSRVIKIPNFFHTFWENLLLLRIQQIEISLVEFSKVILEFIAEISSAVAILRNVRNVQVIG